MNNEFIALIDRKLTSPEIQSFVTKSGSLFEMRKYKTYQAALFKPIGIELTFTLKERLYVIHFHGRYRDEADRRLFLAALADMAA